jgi:hypothetical protein
MAAGLRTSRRYALHAGRDALLAGFKIIKEAVIKVTALDCSAAVFRSLMTGFVQ